MKQKINVFVILRFLVGVLFIVSGAEKLISPYQNFLYVVQSYEIVPSPLDKAIALVLPWIEFFSGIFLFLGFGLKAALRALTFLIGAFILIAGQALLRNLPIAECGCFGELISLPLHVTFLLDVFLLSVVVMLFKNFDQTRQLSLDQRF